MTFSGRFNNTFGIYLESFENNGRIAQNRVNKHENVYLSLFADQPNGEKNNRMRRVSNKINNKSI